MARIGFRKIWEAVRKESFLPETGLLLPDATVFHKYNRTVPTASCRLLRENRYEIVYGMAAIKDFINAVHSRSDTKEQKKHILLMYIAFFYHESAHLLYTDMTLSEIKKISDKVQQSYAATLNNVLEDSYIQYRRMSKDHPHTKKFFLDTDRKLFRDEVLVKYKDDGSFNSVLTYLLYSLRRGKDFKGENSFINAHEEDVNEWVTKYLNEHDAIKRSIVGIAFLEWMLSTGEIVLPETISTEGKSIIDESFDGKPHITKSFGKLEPIVYESKPRKPKAEESRYDGDDVVDEEDEEDVGDDVVDEDAEEDDTIFYEDDREYVEETEDALDASVKEELKPDPYIEALDLLDLNHEFIDLSGYTSSWPELESKDLEAISTIGRSTVKSIMLKLEREKPRWVGGKDTGKLDVGAVISRTDGKVFKEKTKELPIPKLAFSVLMDNSGSIGNKQTEISSAASLSLVKACEELEIPIELNAFTCDSDGSWSDKNTWVTWEIKPFESDFKDGIKNIGKFIYKGGFRVEDHHGFGGNMEEVNISHIASRFTKKYPDKSKIMIVLCDGQTTGSTSKLIEVLNTISKDIYVIGIGLMVNLSSIYKRNFTLSTISEVAELPRLMREILKEFIFGEE